MELSPGAAAATLELIADLYRQTSSAEGRVLVLGGELEEARAALERSAARAAGLEAELVSLAEQLATARAAAGLPAGPNPPPERPDPDA